MVAGRLIDLNEIDNFEIEVLAQGFENNFELKGQANTQKRETIFPDEEYIFGDFTERLWAYLTIQELLDKKDKGTLEEKGNATDEALFLSLKYNFVTPLTSMVVTKPEDETKKSMFIADKLTEGYTAVTASYPTRNYAPTYYVDGDPHFIIELPYKNDALCFNIDDKPGTIFNLVRDPLTGQFYHGLEFEVSEPFPGKDPNKPDAIMFVKGQELVVTRGWQKDFRQDVKNGEKVPCWFIHNNGTGLLDGVQTDYIVSGLFKTI